VTDPNPFVYGEVVPRSAFAGREEELARLVGDLADCQKVFLISPRRYGKSSLVRQALNDLTRRKVATLDVTVSSFSSYVGFLEGYAQALSALDTRVGRAGSWFRDLFTGVKPEMRLGTSAASMTLAFPSVRSARETARLAEDVFALPGRIASRLGRRIAIAFDEFQAVAAFNGGSVEQALRAAVQHQRDVGYVFAGSEPSLMEQMITAKRPFYKAGPVMRLGKLPADVFAAFINVRFRRSGIAPEAGLGEAIVELAGNLPYDVQRLAHETWDDVRTSRRRRAGLDDLHATLHRMLAEQDTMFEAIWQRLTLAQRAALRAVVIEHGLNLLSGEAGVRHRLGGTSTVQASLAALRRDDVIAREDDGRYVVVDSLMREWVARKTF
jgi:hypothetical protein